MNKRTKILIMLIAMIVSADSYAGVTSLEQPVTQKPKDEPRLQSSHLKHRQKALHPHLSIHEASEVCKLKNISGSFMGVTSDGKGGWYCDSTPATSAELTKMALTDAENQAKRSVEELNEASCVSKGKAEGVERHFYDGLCETRTEFDSRYRAMGCKRFHGAWDC